MVFVEFGRLLSVSCSKRTIWEAPLKPGAAGPIVDGKKGGPAVERGVELVGYLLLKTGSARLILTRRMPNVV